MDRTFLLKAGINIASVAPAHIKLYGNGGGMLPQANSSFRHQDLNENAIYVEGEKDGRFDEGDYILFYAQSPHTIKYNETEKQIRDGLTAYMNGRISQGQIVQIFLSD